MGPLIYDEGLAFWEDKAAVSIGGKWGFVDKNGKEVIAFRFNYAITFTDGVGKVLLNDNWYSIDREGTLVKFE